MINTITNLIVITCLIWLVWRFVFGVGAFLAPSFEEWMDGPEEDVEEIEGGA